MLETLQTQLYTLQQFATTLVTEQLSHLTPLSILIIIGAGLLTSLTPCVLSMLPITIGYIGGYASVSTDGSAGQKRAWAPSLWFALGLATTLAGLGVIASSLGQVYGQIGVGLSIVVSAIAILMGLNLLEVIPLQFPSLGTMTSISESLPTGVRAYCIGLSFGLVASPCSTPVLAALLAWVATLHDPVLGGVLLLAYTIGYVSPLVIAGVFTASVKQFLELRRWSGWITPASGAVLLGFGVFSLLSRVSTLF
jgi:cytochrome c-type biogenesis protein